MNNKDYYQGYRKEMKPFLPQNYTKILEIGCGEGNFRKNTKTKCEYWGVELIEEAATKASENLDTVFFGDYFNVKDKIPQKYFDLVICNDVIEHMPDHDTFLQAIKEKIKPEGYLVASLPNIRYWPQMRELLFNKDWQYKDAGILDKTHLRFFTKKSIIRTFENAGFKIEEISGINPFIYRRGIKRLIPHLISIIWGQDVRFAQIAIRAKLGKS